MILTLRLFSYKRISANADEGVDKDFVVVDTTLFMSAWLLVSIIAGR
jgi:hypothetical protein